MKINLTNNKINLPRLKTCFSGRICEVIEEKDKNICEIKTAKYIFDFWYFKNLELKLQNNY